MVEDAQGQEARTPGGGDGGQTALALALGGVSREKAEAFLEKQGRLADEQTALARLQAEDLMRGNKLRHWSLRVHHISDVMKVTFEITAAFVGLAIVVGICAALWTASHDDSLVIESFSVPPDMAARGLTGQAVAAQLQDRLGALQAETESARPADSYASNWGDDIKVQIPSTGIALGDAYRILADWLGHRTYITGEVRETGPGGAVSMTVRAGGNASAQVEGSEAGFDALIGKAALDIYRRTQPYRYSVYLGEHGDANGSRTISQITADTSPSACERAWAHAGLGTIDGFSGRFGEANQEFRTALDELPSIDVEDAMELFDVYEQHGETVLADAAFAEQHLGDGDSREVAPRALAASRAMVPLYREYVLADFVEAEYSEKALLGAPDFEGSHDVARAFLPLIEAGMHDPAAARGAFSAFREAPYHFFGDGRHLFHVLIDYSFHDDAALFADSAAFESVCARAAKAYSCESDRLRLMTPALAAAQAARGNFAEARKLIDITPLDCDLCLRARGLIDARQKRWDAATYWYARAAAFAPSLPQAYSDWGAMLLAKGDFEGAIAKFKIANGKGPHFADPLEMWGEALIAKNRSDLALAKVAEADKYAPNWGRLHLKWGEALLWSGDKADAQKQFAIATHLDLSAADKAELTRVGTMRA
jgi:tetratricopeptide (TPR) repeat protein